ncbi:MAG: DUF11 domain-containing protein [Pseudomonadales bacterium]|nr:DUF11 domain-containing protein [Pseudomonadales bacterium]
MKKGISVSIASALLLAFAAAGQAASQSTVDATARNDAPRGGCIVLKTVAEMEQVYTAENGAAAKRLVPAAKVVPGGEVVWTVTASNVCDKPADKVAIDNPVPDHMRYVADSAMGPGTDIAFSLDGQKFAAPEALTVRGADGAERAARADEYAFIRWTFKNALQPGSVAFARFRAVVK